MALKERLIKRAWRRKSGYERSKRNDLSRGDKKYGRAGSRSECYRQNDTEI